MYFAENILGINPKNFMKLSSKKVGSYTVFVSDIKLRGVDVVLANNGDMYPKSHYEKVKRAISTVDKEFDKISSKVSEDWFDYINDCNYKTKYNSANDIKHDLRLTHINVSYDEKHNIISIVISLDLPQTLDSHIPFTEININSITNKIIYVNQTTFEG